MPVANSQAAQAGTKSTGKHTHKKLTGVFLDAETFSADLLNSDTIDTSLLNNVNIELTCYDNTLPEEVVGRIANADIVLTNKVVLDSEALQHAKALKYVGVMATGTNNVDTHYCQSHNIYVQNVEGYGTDSVAQHTLMLLLNLATAFPQYHNDVEQGKWEASPHFCLTEHPIVELAGKHAVIVGHGELGKRVEALFIAMGMKVSIAARPGGFLTEERIANKRDPRPSLESLLPSADVVSLHCPLTDDNYHLFNEARLSLMKPTSFLINTARGGLVDEEALVAALKRGQIGGAAVDVISQEPPGPNHPLLKGAIPNLIVTPHTAWMANESRQRLFDIAMNHLIDFVETQI
ncbi:D-2-hydroxyacid dehydrogenase [Alteromonas sp. MMG017]|nr:D-2-hydroxyacid dehydrogenase [Alteromonas sp. MMG017]